MAKTIRTRKVHEWTEEYRDMNRNFKSYTLDRLNKRQSGDKFASVVPSWYRRLTNKLNRHRVNNALRASLVKDLDDMVLPVCPNSIRWTWF